MDLCGILGHRFEDDGASLSRAHSVTDEKGIIRVFEAKWCYREKGWILPPLPDHYMDAFFGRNKHAKRD